jgi:hypothetical protein
VVDVIISEWLAGDQNPDSEKVGVLATYQEFGLKTPSYAVLKDGFFATNFVFTHDGV